MRDSLNVPQSRGLTNLPMSMESIANFVDGTCVFDFELFIMSSCPGGTLFGFKGEPNGTRYLWVPDIDTY